MKRARVYAGIAVAILCMATSAILVRESSAPPLIIAFYRLLFTAVLALLLGHLKPIGRVRYLPLRSKALLTLAGAALSLHFALWITSLSMTSVASSVLFTNLQVIFVLIMSAVLLKERIGVKTLLGIMTALAGSLFIAGGDLGRGRMAGDILALTSGLFIAIALIVARDVRAHIDLWTYTFHVSITAACCLLLMGVASGQELYPYTGRDFFLFFLMALLPGIGGHGLINWALKYVKAPVVAVSILGESVGASILAYIIFGERMVSYQLTGGLLILLGIYIAATGERLTDRAS